MYLKENKRSVLSTFFCCARPGHSSILALVTTLAPRCGRTFLANDRAAASSLARRVASCALPMSTLACPVSDTGSVRAGRA